MRAAVSRDISGGGGGACEAATAGAPQQNLCSLGSFQLFFSHIPHLFQSNLAIDLAEIGKLA